MTAWQVLNGCKFASSRTRNLRVTFLLIGLLTIHAIRAVAHEQITIDDLVGRVQIPVVSLSPDGSRVAYLTVEGISRRNAYRVVLRLIFIRRNPANAALLAVCNLPSEETFDADTGWVKPTLAQFVWKGDSTALAYVTHCNGGAELKIRKIGNGSESSLLAGYNEIQISSEGAGNNILRIATLRHADERKQSAKHPLDLGLLVKDGYRFYGSFSNPKLQGKFLSQSWNYDWKTIEQAGTVVSSYRGFPDEWQETTADSKVTKQPDSVVYTREETRSPDGKLAAMIEDSTLQIRDPVLAHRETRIVLKDLENPHVSSRLLVDSVRPPSARTILGWRRDGGELYYIDEGAQHSVIAAVTPDGQIRELYKADAGISAPSGSSEISRDGGTIVVVRSTNTTPDELLRVDAKTGVATVLDSPNKKFKSTNPATVRFMQIPCCGGRFQGRLYLPKDYSPNKTYPLVFTNYLSTPGFYASVGDEVPILVMVQRGIAVFALQSSAANMISRDGDFRFEIERVARPLEAMEWVRNHLANDGVIDPARCGLTGVSYGAEIAMYAYWKSRSFRAISVATTSWEPMNYFLAGASYSKFLDSRGLVAGEANLENWRQLSASLNVGPEVPPLLIQSPDKEEYFGNVETWFSIRKHQLPVEWLIYPNEGHVKRSPANKWWVYQRNLDWFRFWLQDYEDADSNKLDQYLRWRQMRKREFDETDQTN